MNKIWVRYFLSELCKVFFLVIFSFYFLYVLIDYSAHSKAFHTASLSEILLYYAYHFAKRADVLVTVTLLISTIKVLTTFNLKNEIVALAASGISLKKLLHPFLFAAFIAASLIYLNFQYVQPFSLKKIETFEEAYFDYSTKENKKRVHAIALADNSLLLYQSFDPVRGAFFDSYWIKNLDEIYKIQTLLPFKEIPKGEFVDKLIRSSDGEMMRECTYPAMLFENLHFEKKSLFSEIYPANWQSYSQLVKGMSFKKLLRAQEKISDKEAEAATHFFYKLLIPLTAFLAVLGPGPFCLKFSRNLPVFLLFAVALFAIFSFFTIAGACLILGSSQVLSSFWPLFLLFGSVYVFCGVHYARL